MQAARCFHMLYQCPPKATALLKYFRLGKSSGTAQSQHKTNPGRLYLCTKSIVTERTSEGPSDGPSEGSREDLSAPQSSTVDDNTDYFKKLVANPPSTSIALEEVVVERKLRIKTHSLSELRPSLPPSSGNLAPYVNDSRTLTELVNLGVDLSVLESHQNVANHLLTAVFEKDVQPYIEFLLALSVDVKDLSRVLTKNPGLLLEDIADLQVRVNYLQSKRFSSEAVARIVSKAPHFLSQSTQITDTQLGALQRLFCLSGAELRQVVTALPNLTTWPRGLVQDMHFVVHEFLGFSDREQKEMLLIQPKLYTSNRKKVELTFDYAHNTMGLSHATISQWPQIFRTRLFIIRQRHTFLQSLDRAQYDPTKANFVSLKALVSGRDVQFCENVAKVSVSEFNNFLKTL